MTKLLHLAQFAMTSVKTASGYVLTIKASLILTGTYMSHITSEEFSRLEHFKI